MSPLADGCSSVVRALLGAPDLVCELSTGHAGEHRQGVTTWTETDASEAPRTGTRAYLNTLDVLNDVMRERHSQDRKWGPQRHDPVWWLAILTEEVGEAAQEVLGLRFGDAAKAHGDLRKELLHVAAVAVSAIETLDFGAAGIDTPHPETQQGIDA